MEKRLLTVKELAVYIGTTVGSIYTLTHMGKIPRECVVKLGRSLRFEREAIDAWINQQKPSGPSPACK